jgi:Ca2+-binding EF-hand superfamily protein
MNLSSTALNNLDLNMKRDEMMKLIDEIDLDQDGKICFEEFVLAMIGK